MSIGTGECSKTAHITGLSQWLMKNLVASPFMGDGRLTAVGSIPDATFCHSEFSPTKVGAKILRHQLRTEVRSMVCL